MFCSKKKFAPKSIPQELMTPLAFSINDTKYTMKSYEGFKSNNKSLRQTKDKNETLIRDRMDLLEDLSA